METPLTHTGMAGLSESALGSGRQSQSGFQHQVCWASHQGKQCGEPFLACLGSENRLLCPAPAWFWCSLLGSPADLWCPLPGFSGLAALLDVAGAGSARSSCQRLSLCTLSWQKQDQCGGPLACFPFLTPHPVLCWLLPGVLENGFLCWSCSCFQQE